MLQRIRDVWKMLGTSIYEGERYERSTRNLGIMPMQLVVVSAVRNAVSAATTTFTASSIILFFVIF